MFFILSYFFPIPVPGYSREWEPLIPVPEMRECIFFIPFPFPSFGNRFLHSFPIPEFWECFFRIPFPFPNFGNGFFPFPSRSRTSGMELSISVPFWNAKKSFPLTLTIYCRSLLLGHHNHHMFTLVWPHFHCRGLSNSRVNRNYS